MEKRIKNILIALGIILGMIFLVSAYQLATVYNPWTGKLDYIVSSNFSGDVLTGGDIISEENVTIETDGYICLDGKACTKYIFANSTTIVIQG